MSENRSDSVSPPKKITRPVSPLKTSIGQAAPAGGDETVLCERCGQAGMYRMHAVWRCPNCGFKTDCCGW